MLAPRVTGTLMVKPLLTPASPRQPCRSKQSMQKAQGNSHTTNAPLLPTEFSRQLLKGRAGPPGS
eukprot:4998114-Pleurochrysis_carterae.AAC.3